MSLTSILHDIFTNPVTEDVARLVPGASLAFKVNDVVKKAKKGDRDAQAKLVAIKQLADSGDPKAQAAIEQAKVVAAQTAPKKQSFYEAGVAVGHDPYAFVGALYDRNLPPGTVIVDHTTRSGPAPGQPGSGYHMEGRRLVPCDAKAQAAYRAQIAQYKGPSHQQLTGCKYAGYTRPGSVVDHRTTVTPAQRADAIKAFGTRAPVGPQVTPGFGAQYDALGNYLGSTDPSKRGTVTVDDATGQAYDPQSGVTFDPNTGQVISQPGVPSNPALPPGMGPGGPGPVPPGMGYPPGMDPYGFPPGMGYPPGVDPYGFGVPGYGPNPYGGYAPPGYGAAPGGQPYDPYGLLQYLSQLGMGDPLVSSPRRQVYDENTGRFYSDDTKMKYDADTDTFVPTSCYNPYAALDQAYGGDPYGAFDPQVAGWAYNRPYRTVSEALVQKSPGAGASARELYNRGLGQPATSTDTVARTALARNPVALAAYGLARRVF